MTENVNGFHEASGLRQALGEIHDASKRYQRVGVDDPSRTFNTELVHAIETRDIIDNAETIALSALAREGSRGAHWRRGNQQRDDERWLHHSMVRWRAGTPELYYTPVVRTGHERTYEPAERSY
jgi:succinate dehydrogenase subunit A (EC 1.3.5.1)